MKGLTLFKQVRVRQGRCFSAWRMWIRVRGQGWCSSQRDDLWSSTDTDDDWIVWVKEEDGLMLFFLCLCPYMCLVLKSVLTWQANFSGPCLTILYPAFLSHMQSILPFFPSPDRKGFKRQRGNPAWGLFWYCWTFSWKTFLLGDQQCSGFTAIGFSCLNTLSDHNSKNVSDELQTCSIFIAWARNTSVRQPTIEFIGPNSTFKFNVCRFSHLSSPPSL